MSKKGSRGWVPIQSPGQMVQIWLGKGRLREGPEAMETSEHQSVQVLCRMDGDEKRMGRNCETTAVSQLEMKTMRES